MPKRHTFFDINDVILIGSPARKLPILLLSLQHLVLFSRKKTTTHKAFAVNVERCFDVFVIIRTFLIRNTNTMSTNMPKVKFHLTKCISGRLTVLMNALRIIYLKTINVLPLVKCWQIVSLSYVSCNIYHDVA